MKGRIVQPGTHNATVGQKYGDSAGKRFMPLREFMGKDRDGKMVGKTVWHDMHANKSYDGGNNWETAPPDLPSGDPGKQAAYQPKSERYRENYGHIDWSA